MGLGTIVHLREKSPQETSTSLFFAPKGLVYFIKADRMQKNLYYGGVSCDKSRAY